MKTYHGSKKVSTVFTIKQDVKYIFYK
jgi:hypothetical protein